MLNFFSLTRALYLVFWVSAEFFADSLRLPILSSYSRKRIEHEKAWMLFYDEGGAHPAYSSFWDRIKDYALTAMLFLALFYNLRCGS